MSVDDQDRQSDRGLAPGSIIADRFQVQSKLGEGGMGSVYSAINAATGRKVALKIMHPEFAIKKDIVRRFMREAKAATAIRHPNVIEIYDVVQGEEGEPVMVMELLDGEVLDRYMARLGPLSFGEVARIMTPVVSAVGAAHALGIIHRDLKPENIFLATRSDGRNVPKVLDFGIAKVLDPNQINELATGTGATRTGSMLGTPHYMSVEQACGEKDIDHRSDIWSLGIILYSMLSGRRPYDGENYGQILKSLMTTSPAPIESLVPGLPGDLIDIVTRCTSRAKEQRPEDLREVHTVLARYTQDTSLQVPAAVVGSLLSRQELVSAATLAATSFDVSRSGRSNVRWAVTKRPQVFLVGALLVGLLGGGVAIAFGLGAEDVSPVAEPVASSVGIIEPPPAPSPEAESAAALVEVVHSADVAPSSTPPEATAKRVPPLPKMGVPTATGGATATRRTTATQPETTPPKPSGRGIIETLPY